MTPRTSLRPLALACALSLGLNATSALAQAPAQPSSALPQVFAATVAQSHPLEQADCTRRQSTSGESIAITAAGTTSLLVGGALYRQLIDSAKIVPMTSTGEVLLGVGLFVAGAWAASEYLEAQGGRQEQFRMFSTTRDDVKTSDGAGRTRAFTYWESANCYASAAMLYQTELTLQDGRSVVFASPTPFAQGEAVHVRLEAGPDGSLVSVFKRIAQNTQ